MAEAKGTNPSAERAAAALLAGGGSIGIGSRPSTAMSTRRERPRAQLQAFLDSQQAYEDAQSLSLSKNYSPKYDSKKFNILRGIQNDRLVTKESLKRSNIGLDGLKRYDVNDLGAARGSLPEYYMAELLQKTGSTHSDVNLFTIKGLHNYSNLPRGDLRVGRTTTMLKEQFIPPGDRAEFPAKYDHLQTCEATHRDTNLGPSTLAQAKHTSDGSVALSSKATCTGLFDRDGHPLREEDSASEALSEDAFALREKRVRYYRDAIEAVNALRLDRLEKTMRDKLDMYAAGAPGSFHLRSTFRYFDRDAQGAVSFGEFVNGLRLLGFKQTDNLENVALFARYDVQQRGFLDYYEFINHVMSKDYLSDRYTKDLGAHVKQFLDYLRRPGAQGNISLDLNELQVPYIDVHELSDDQFMHRQNVRCVFSKLDKDNSGFLDEAEFSRLLAIIGVHAAPMERQQIFAFIARLSLNAAPTGLSSMAVEAKSSSIWSCPPQKKKSTVSFEAFYKWFMMDLGAQPKPEAKNRQDTEFGFPASGMGSVTFNDQ